MKLAALAVLALFASPAFAQQAPRSAKLYQEPDHLIRAPAEPAPTVEKFRDSLVDRPQVAPPEARDTAPLPSCDPPVAKNSKPAPAPCPAPPR